MSEKDEINDKIADMTAIIETLTARLDEQKPEKPESTLVKITGLWKAEGKEHFSGGGYFLFPTTSDNPKAPDYDLCKREEGGDSVV